MNLAQLRYFATLARLRHFTRAAEELCITQPSLSHAIAQLERELGLPLFERRGRTTALTSYGEEFLTHVEASLAALDEGVDAMGRRARGEGLVRLGLVRPLGMDLVPALARSHADACRERGLTVSFSFHTGISEELLEGLRRHAYDLAFCSQPPEGAGFAWMPVCRRELVLITPRDHELAKKGRATPGEAARYDQVFFCGSSGIRDEIEAIFRSCGAQPHVVAQTEEDEVVAGLVAHGFGVAIVPRMRLLDQLDVCVLELDAPEASRDLCLVWRPGPALSVAAQAFVEHVRSELG